MNNNGKILSINGKIQLTITTDQNMPLTLTAGDKIYFKSRIKPIRNFNNPGSFDFKKNKAFQGISASSYIDYNKLKLVLIEKSNKNNYANFIGKTRSNISKLISENIVKYNNKAVLKALLIGDSQEISYNLRNQFSRVGVSHILAISGLHIGIIASISILFFKFMLSYIDFFLWNAWTKKGAVILSMFPVWGYSILAGMSPSTQRSVIMITIILLAALFEKEHEPINTLAFAAMIIITIYPPSLLSISFQLSFISVFSLLYGMYKIKKISNKLLLSLLTTTFTTIGTIPIIMLYFNQFSIAAFLGNLILIPMICLAVVPIGLIAVCFYPINLYVSGWIFYLCSLILEPSLSIINFLSNFNYSAFTTITPSYFEICIYYIIVGLTINFKYFKNKYYLLIYILFLFVLSADIFYWCYKRFWDNNLTVTMIDVGQGNSSLLELPHGYCVLIDGGGFYDNLIFDIGANIVSKFLWQKKIKTIDTIILTHSNSDHLNGILYIASNFNVKNIWLNDEDTKESLINIIKDKKINHIDFNKLNRKQIINGVQFEILSPPIDFLEKRKIENWRDDNNNSLVTKVTFGSKSFLFPGDIKQKTEKELVELYGNKLKTDILLAPHHGSKTSSTEIFLNYVKPHTVIFSVGFDNYFKFPHTIVLNRYNDLGCEIFMTDYDGAITIKTDGKYYSLKRYPP